MWNLQIKNGLDVSGGGKAASENTAICTATSEVNSCF
jgi:hypothetical protein